MAVKTAVAAAVALTVAPTVDVVALTDSQFVEFPPMGWNSWYALGRQSGWPNTTESVIRETVDAMAGNGLLDAGYEFVVIDDSWENPNGMLGRFPVTCFIVGCHHSHKNLATLLREQNGRNTTATAISAHFVWTEVDVFGQM